MHVFLLSLSLLVWGDDLSKLGDDSFWVREAATRRLKNAAPLSYFAVEKGLQSPDLEVRRRCREIMTVMNVRLDPLYNVSAYFEATLLIYGEGNSLTKEQERQILTGGRRLHQALSDVAKLHPALRNYVSVYETYPMNYRPEEMLGFVFTMRQILHGSPYGG